MRGVYIDDVEYIRALDIARALEAKYQVDIQLLANELLRDKMKTGNSRLVLTSTDIKEAVTLIDRLNKNIAELNIRTNFRYAMLGSLHGIIANIQTSMKYYRHEE